ncbi:protamine-like [Hermetia illucens]|uniref:protamine-like n=1 Tax=Hermetia illucens TaxID=343691 RepID=UPI0018CC2D87|nr:protamine-like [Hermetia illucens]
MQKLLLLNLFLVVCLSLLLIDDTEANSVGQTGLEILSRFTRAVNRGVKYYSRETFFKFPIIKRRNSKLRKRLDALSRRNKRKRRRRRRKKRNRALRRKRRNNTRRRKKRNGSQKRRKKQRRWARNNRNRSKKLRKRSSASWRNFNGHFM